MKVNVLTPDGHVAYTGNWDGTLTDMDGNPDPHGYHARITDAGRHTPGDLDDPMLPPLDIVEPVID